jgi:molybdenum cofactor guanylyltransferase
MPATPPRGWGLPGPAPRQAGPRQAGPGQAATLPAFDAIVLAGGRAERLGGVDKPGLVVGTATMAATVTRAAVAAGARRVVLVGPPRAELAGDLAGDGGELAVVREDPPGGGPVPALRAGLADSGLAEVGAPWVVLLAADLPFLRAEHIRELMAAAVRQRDDAGDDARRDADARSAGRCDMEPDDLSGDRSGAPVQRVGGSAAGGSSGSSGAGAILTDERGAPQWLAGCWPAARLRSALAGYPGSSLRGLLGPLRPARISLAGPAGTPPPWLDCDTPAELAAARGWYDRAAPQPVPQPVPQPAQPAPQPRPAATLPTARKAGS